jgi:hypothetical protein
MDSDWRSEKIGKLERLRLCNKEIKIIIGGKGRSKRPVNKLDIGAIFLNLRRLGFSMYGRPLLEIIIDIKIGLNNGMRFGLKFNK